MEEINHIKAILSSKGKGGKLSAHDISAFSASRVAGKNLFIETHLVIDYATENPQHFTYDPRSQVVGLK